MSHTSTHPEVPAWPSLRADDFPTELRYATEVPPAVVCNRWKPVILWHLNHAPRRNGELRRLMPLISQKVLTQQLRELEHHGLIVRTAHDVTPPKVVYSVTDDGRELWGIVEGLYLWSVRWAYRHGARVSAFERMLDGENPG